jgi:hypothetical protein
MTHHSRERERGQGGRGLLEDFMEQFRSQRPTAKADVPGRPCGPVKAAPIDKVADLESRVAKLGVAIIALRSEIASYAATRRP